MNIVVAFTLEAFLLEYESQRTELETRVDRRIRELGLESKKSTEQVVFDKEQSYVENGVQFKLGKIQKVTKFKVFKFQPSTGYDRNRRFT